MRTNTLVRYVRGGRGARLLMAGGLAVLTMPLFAGPSQADDFSNATAIVIPGPPPPAGCPQVPGPNNSCPATTATPYPSEITVGGLTGTVTDVNVVLKGLTHDGPADLDVLLEAPDGKTVMLMSDACGADNGVNPITSAIDLTFDDSAAAELPADAPCAAGTFKPVDDDNDPEFQFTGADAFPAPAPAAAPVVVLSSLNGISPNGAWKLYVADDYPGDVGRSSGQFAGGWTLSVATTTTGAITTTTTTAGTSTTFTTATTRAPAVAATTPTTVAILPRTGPSGDRGVLLGIAGALIAAGLTLQLVERRAQRTRT